MFQISTVYAPTVFLKLVFFFLMMMSYYTLAIEFIGLKYYTNYLFYQFFFSPLDFFFFSSFFPLLFFSSHSLLCHCFFFSLYWRKKQRGRFWKQKVEKKKVEYEIYGYTFVVQKKKDKKKKNIWMKEWKYYYNIFTINFK